MGEKADLRASARLQGLAATKFFSYSFGGRQVGVETAGVFADRVELGLRVGRLLGAGESRLPLWPRSPPRPP
eukprot:11202510-Lingulodinium_polyedra.AAC.1